MIGLFWKTGLAAGFSQEPPLFDIVNSGFGTPMTTPAPPEASGTPAQAMSGFRKTDVVREDQPVLLFIAGAQRDGGWNTRQSRLRGGAGATPRILICIRINTQLSSQRKPGPTHPLA
jgi:hypothetical protein